MKPHDSLCCGVALLIFTVTPVLTLADPAVGDVSSLIKGMLAPCVAIKDRDERLACFDSLAAESEPPADPTRVNVTAAHESNGPPTTRPEDFGLSAAQQERAKPQVQLNSITEVVASIWHSSSGRMLVELNNGQSWELDRSDPLLAPGDKVTIEHAAMGSYLLRTPARRYYHAHRQH